MISRSVRNLSTAICFLSPNILGFAIFTLMPLVFTVALAFTNFDLRYQNAFHHAPLRFVGLRNFLFLVKSPDFWRFLGNTLFFMVGIPISIAGSLLLALLLSRSGWKDPRKLRIRLFATCSAVAAAVILVLLGTRASGLTILLTSVGAIIMLGGMAGGTVVYRTLLYLPSFTSGVAVFILWKKLYNPEDGPINQSLRPLLNMASWLARTVPASIFFCIQCACIAVAIWAALRFLARIRRARSDADLGWAPAHSSAVIISSGMILGGITCGLGSVAGQIAIVAGVVLLIRYGLLTFSTRFIAVAPWEGAAVTISLALCTALGCVGICLIGRLTDLLPRAATSGLAAPQWLTNYYWAKPALMIMAFWAAIGSNNMLLYLAGIANIPPELYEAADIDGADGFGRFWNVTWPQVAPTTFFILVMSVIGGLQGGFEMAKTMTDGGPAGSTSTLSYYIYTQGFETGRLAYASAISWTLFMLTLLIMAIGWRFGSQYVND